MALFGLKINNQNFFYRLLLENLSWMENWTVHTPRNLSCNWNNENSVIYLLQAFLLQGIFLWHSFCSCFCHNNILYFDSNYYNWGYLWDLEKGQGISMLWILQTFVIINSFLYWSCTPAFICLHPPSKSFIWIKQTWRKTTRIFRYF